MIKLYHHQRVFKINAIKRQKSAFSQHSHSQDINQKFESALRILKFVIHSERFTAIMSSLKFNKFKSATCKLEKC